ncbi:MAG: signal recognition particle protein, partial [Paracoccaceae bacterium]|nr:signal recognition particle protein [Paracoccaceae bacterium]
KGMMGKGGMPGGMPDMNDPKAMEEAAKALQGKMPGGMGGLGGLNLPGGLSGLGGFGKKK